MSALEEEVKKVQGKLVASEKNKNRLALEVEDLAQELEAVSPDWPLLEEQRTNVFYILGSSNRRGVG